MPCIKVKKNGYRIRRSKGGLYPKVYKSLRTCKVRVAQMEMHKNMAKKGKGKGKKKK